ncbi:MAG: hypothetical protein F4Y02_14105 [Chloroflexi bacterium]|nr:hypothetical protein [Chloroflexota bacterium]
MRIVRSPEGRARLAIAAGFQLGARPAALPASQRDLFSALAHRAFVSVLEQAAQARCQAFICGQGLFAESPPSLENVRAAMAPLELARRAGMTVVATGEPPGPATDGSDFLAEVGLVDAVLSSQASESVVVSVAGLQIGLVTGHPVANSAAADLTIEIVTGEGEAAGSVPPTGLADVVIDTRAAEAGWDRVDDVLVVTTGWAGLSLDRHAESGFVILDIDSASGVVPSFVPTEVLRPARLVIEMPASGGEVENLVAPELGTARILDVELRGRTPRAAWHEMDPSSLIERATSAGTLLRFGIDELVVDDSPHSAGALARSSLLVNVRRTSERLLAGAGDDNHRELIAAARGRVVEIARRREPTKAMS